MLEMSIVLVVIGVMTGLAAPRLAGYVDRIAVKRAENETAAFYGRARIAAVYRAVRVRIGFTGDSLYAIAEGVVDSSIERIPGPIRHGVTLTASRAVIRIYPNGLGLGAANTKLVFRRGEAADSVTISRLGRLRRWP